MLAPLCRSQQQAWHKVTQLALPEYRKPEASSCTLKNHTEGCHTACVCRSTSLSSGMLLVQAALEKWSAAAWGIHLGDEAARDVHCSGGQAASLHQPPHLHDHDAAGVVGCHGLPGPIIMMTILQCHACLDYDHVIPPHRAWEAMMP